MTDSENELRVLVVATTFPRWAGDAEPRFVFDLTQRLAKKVSLWALVPHAPGAEEYETMEGVRIIRYPYAYPKSQQVLCYEGGILPKLKSNPSAKKQLPGFLLAQAYHLWRTVRKHKINFIHCHWIVPQGFFVSLIHSITGIPFILTALGGDVYAFQKNPIARAIKRFALSRASACAVNSLSVKETLESIYADGVYPYIPNGVDETIFCAEKYDPQLKSKLGIEGPFLLGVGRFAEKKGFRYLIDALPKILEEEPSARLVLVGFGPEEEALKCQVQELGLTGKVLFPGSKSGEELARFYATADVFIGPSIIAESGDTEGQGVVFLEALASKTAVVASDVGGIVDMIKDGKTGLTVPQKNSPALAEKIIALCKNPELKQELAENGRRLVEEHYCWNAIAEKYLKLYKTIKL
ncbi:MAG: hypothetical protein COV66_01455 [Nitrospinae bacterium CG11_big_fil_rev_8_21_14_0_20_45_15]|nr:MAG: hypothetical protein COV66_01455 [Nitrospinae bacterium CG11_big_fil_rev_8_21_14_0_20_45_15]